MFEFKEIPFDEEQQKKLENLIETARKMRAAQVFNNPMLSLIHISEPTRLVKI